MWTFTRIATLIGLAGAVGAPAAAQAAPFQSGAAAALTGGGLVAAYGMDAGSGTVLADLSGTGNNGTITGATWSASGKYGSALSFTGSNLVTVPDSNSLDLTVGMTQEAWVRPSALTGTWRDVLMKERPGGMAYDLYAHGTPSLAGPTAEINIGGADQTADGTPALELNTWTHLASTFDGATLRLYVNGAQVAQKAVGGSLVVSTGALRIGGNVVYGGENFQGLIDEVRIYNRALSAAEIQDDMNTAVGPADTVAPSRPTGLSATGSLGGAQLSWSAATDNVGVARYNVHRSSTPGFTPSAANRIAQPTTTTYSDTPAAGIYYYAVTAQDAAGNVSAASDETPPTAVGDLVAPSAPGTLSATGAIGKATLSWGAASDNVGVARYSVYRSSTAGFTPSAANRIAQPTTPGYVDTAAPGTYFYKVIAEDAAGNAGPESNQATATITTDASAPTAPSGLTATPAGGNVTLAWTASTDNVGVARYAVYRSTSAGFTPSAANRIAQPTGVGYTDPGLASGTYYYRVTAEDAAGNVSGASNQATATVVVVAPTGLVAAYGFDEGSGTTAADRSGNGNTGTLTSAAWAPAGKFGAALSFAGSARVNVPDSPTLRLSTGMTLEAWVRPNSLSGYSTVVLKERAGFYSEALYANTDGNRPSANAYTTSDHELRGSSAVAVGVWTHLAATYNGSTLTLFVNGSAVGTQATTGALLNDAGALRIGGNAIWGEYFNGLIDEVRVYNRALSATEIQADMDRSVTPDITAPTVTGRFPAPNAAGVNVGSAFTATFSEPMKASTVTAASVTLVDDSGTAVPATVDYDAASAVATLKPQSALAYGDTYTLTVKTGVTDLAGNPLAGAETWSFTTEASPPQILVVSAAANPFGAYAAEVLRNEGLDAFTTIDVSLLTPTLLSGFDVVVLGESALSAAQVATLSGWVNAGGNLVALRPDKQLAGLLGLTTTTTTLANAYLKIDTASAAGSGLVAGTVQFHGTADRYTLNGAQAIATLYSNATTVTANPAVTLRSVGSAGGQAAAFTYDLGRSVVYTRQGNPAWAGQERDGASALRPDDMFFGAKVGDVQPDWVDTSRIAIPQADEQQRLLVNLITLMERDKLPLPHFWYLPRGLKAAVVMSGDDHSPGSAPGGTASHFNRYKALSPAGCSVADWTCVRSTSYVYPDSTLTNAQAAGFVADGFEVGLHPQIGSCPTTVPTPAQLAAVFDTQLQQWAAKFTSVPSPVSSRTHCVEWPDWVSEAKIELARGIRLDANYYHYPAAWIGAKPGFLNGGGFPMRFADLDGSLIDVYQQNTNMTDESGQAYPATVNSLLDNALGANGYYGVFGANMHTDNAAPHAGAEAIVASAQARGVPVISYKQLLTWVDGRNRSTIRDMRWSADKLDFATTVGAGADGLQTLLPTAGPSGTLSALSCNGAPKAYTVQTVKGIAYAMFTTVTGTCRATYS